LSNIKPVLVNGMKPVLKAGFGVLSFPFGETIAFLMIFPFLDKKGKLTKIISSSTIIAGFLLLIIVLRDIFALNPILTPRAAFPAEIASKLFPNINIYPLILVNLLIGGAVKVVICLYSSATAITELTGLSDYRAIIFPLSFLSIVLSIWLYDNALEMFTFANKIYPYYALPFQIFIPLMLLLISIIRRMRLKDKST
jgi:spore germination protein KB